MKKRSDWWRPFAWGDVWDRMTPEERSSAFKWGIMVALIGAAAIFLAFGGLG